MIMETCFMCDKPAATFDHIPPKCIFPEQKDVGIDYRRGLIKVPACVIHNLGTSLDDEYIMGVLAFHWRNNEVAYKQSLSKIARALKRNKRYYDLFFGEGKHQILYSNGERLITTPIDIKRFDSILQKIARGIYYSHFQRKWLKTVDIQSISLLEMYDRNPSPVITDLKQVAQIARLLCSKEPRHGANPDIFYYQVVQANSSADIIMRLVFYCGFEVMAFLNDFE